MKNNIEIALGQVPMGTIVAFGLNDKSIPEGWLLCNGSEIPSKYQSLITALGSNQTPNLCGRTLIGTGHPTNDKQPDGTVPNFDPSNNWPLAYTGGEYKHQLTIDELAKHSHTINDGDFGLHNRSFKGSDDKDIPFKTHSDDKLRLKGTDVSGGDGFHNNMQPYYAVNYNLLCI